MRKTRLTDTITYLEPDSMKSFQACAGLIVEDAGQKLLIDTNMGPGETAAMLEEERPDRAVISHYHLDHATWGATALEHSEAELFVPEREAAYLTDLAFFLEHTAGPFGLAEPWREFSVNVTGYREIDRFTPYTETDRFNVGGTTIEVVGTPGHSPAHMAFRFPEEGILFTGDMGVDAFGPWYGWRDCDLKQLVASTLRLRGLSVNLMVTSHGGIIRSGFSRVWEENLLRLLERERAIYEKLERGMARTDIVEEGIFFRSKADVSEPLRSFLYMWDGAMFDHHRELIAEGGLLSFFPELSSLLS